MDNHYLADALYCLRRASRALSDQMNRDGLYDATTYFAFGIEKLCKAVVHDINPLFLLESPKFENASALLYANRVRESAREKLGKQQDELNRSLVPFKPSLLMAARFSQVIEDHFGAFTYLGDLRGIVAHRSIDEMDIPEASRFLVRLFHPVVHKLAGDLDFDPMDCFDSDKKETELKEASASLVGTDDFKNRLDALIQTHKESWIRMSQDQPSVQSAAMETAEDLHRHGRGEPYFQSTDCLACGQHALLLYRFIDKTIEDGVATVGAYAIGLWCHYCKLMLQGYGAVDYFKLNGRLEAFNSRK